MELLSYLICPFCRLAASRHKKIEVGFGDLHCLSCECPDQHQWQILVRYREQQLNSRPFDQLTVIDVFGEDWRLRLSSELLDYLEMHHSPHEVSNLTNAVRKATRSVFQTRCYNISIGPTLGVLVDEVADKLEENGQVSIRYYGAKSHRAFTRFFSCDDRMAAAMLASKVV